MDPSAHSAPPSRPTGRRIGAVLAGIALIFALSLGTDEALHLTGLYPPWGVAMSDDLFLLALAYRLVYGIGGGYLTARLAPDRPMGHAMILGGIGVVLSSLGVVATARGGPELGPMWYPVALVATAPPCVWAGARLFRGSSAPEGA